MKKREMRGKEKEEFESVEEIVGVMKEKIK